MEFHDIGDPHSVLTLVERNRWKIAQIPICFKLATREEWFHRCPDVITLELHFIGTEALDLSLAAVLTVL